MPFTDVARVQESAFAGFERTRCDAKSMRDRRLELMRQALQAAAAQHRALRELFEYERANPEPESLVEMLDRFGRK